MDNLTGVMSSPEPATTPTRVLPSSTTVASTPSLSANRSTPSTAPLLLHATSSQRHGALPPMTTHWTKPRSCTWTHAVGRQSGEVTAGVDINVAWLDQEPIVGATTLSCYPDGMFLDGNTGVFSPATCPGGWSTATIQVNTGHEDWSQVTTTAVCCSSYFSFDGSHCRRSMPTVLAVPMSYDWTTSPSYQIFPSSTTTIYNGAMAVYAIRALFREEDKELLGLVDDADISEDEVHSHSLSTGVRAGIGLAVAAFVVVLTGAIAFCLLHHRKRRRRRQTKFDNSLHELANVGTRTAHESAARVPHQVSCGTRDGILVAEPPPAYEASTATDSNEHLGDVGDARQNEIRALVAQKAAIQQRIQELERLSGDAGPD